MVVGILKNKEQDNTAQHQDIDHNSSKEDLQKFRKQVYENTLLNAKLTDQQNHKGIKRLSETSLSSPNEFEGETEDGHHFKVPKDVLQMKLEQNEPSTPPKQVSNENIMWNKKNLDDNEILKQQYQDIHVDEPKTPYQGAIDLQGEYYRVDDDDLEDFSLGEAAVEPEEEGEKPKKSFAELRKEHYKLGNALKK
ncbi:uncharacterized protein HGUI_00771 [Hanseniaspora guilliermondii]|uniref:Protein GLC8 n=1 Tax=Hanseniaspora guilliermondii TaxID=56406 RepID=A0A1L0B0S7_9ASCO|nr:uncharacterized protein HGUI_00771 [Hanseniaspora guilliermondii]